MLTLVVTAEFLLFFIRHERVSMEWCGHESAAPRHFPVDVSCFSSRHRYGIARCI